MAKTKKFRHKLVESVRDGLKVKQKIIRHVGIALDEDELKRI